MRSFPLSPFPILHLEVSTLLGLEIIRIWKVGGADSFQHFCGPCECSRPIRLMLQGFNVLFSRKTKTTTLFQVFKVSALEHWL
jgi:hypothetical protein